MTVILCPCPFPVHRPKKWLNPVFCFLAHSWHTTAKFLLSTLPGQVIERTSQISLQKQERQTTPQMVSRRRWATMTTQFLSTFGENGVKAVLECFKMAVSQVCRWNATTAGLWEWGLRWNWSEIRLATIIWSPKVLLNGILGICFEHP